MNRTPGPLRGFAFFDLLELDDYLVLAGILLLPWAFGGVEIWAYRGASLLLIAAGAVGFAHGGPRGLGMDRTTRWLLPAALLACWAAVQLLPLPPGAISLLSPTAETIYREAAPGYPEAMPEDIVSAIQQRGLEAVPEAAEIEGPRPESAFSGASARPWKRWRTLSLSSTAGTERLFWYVALLVGFLVVRQRTGDEEGRRLYRTALFAMFLALAVFGLLQAATAGGRIYWIRVINAPAHPFGPYINPTHFAGAMELALPWLAGHTLAAMRASRDAPWPALLRQPVSAVGAILCLVAGLATASRFAAILMLASIALLALLAVRSVRARMVTALALLGGLIAAVIALRESRLGERVEELLLTATGGAEEVNRWVAWKSVMPMLSDFAWVGVGFGAFREVFPRYMPTGELLLWKQLHNDYLEFAIEAGLIGVLLLLWLGFAFWRRALGTVFNARELDLGQVGLLLGLLSLSTHAIVDFNHQIPGNALLFVAMAAMALTVPGPSAEHRSRS